MRDAGRSDGLDRIVQTLQSHAKHSELTNKQRNAYLRTVAVALHGNGLPDQGRQVIAKVTGPEVLPDYFRGIYATTKFANDWSEAVIWSQEFASRHPKESLQQRLKRIDDVIWATKPLNELQPIPSAVTTTYGSGVPATHFRYGLHDESIRIIELRARKYFADYQMLFENYLAKKEYAQAAEAASRAYSSYPRSLECLYFAGHCWELAGEQSKGKRLKLTARMLAVSPGAKQNLVTGLVRLGLADEALKVDQTLLPNLVPASPEYLRCLYEAARLESDTTGGNELWQELRLYFLRPAQPYASIENWLQTDFQLRVARARTAVEAGRFDAARQHWNQAIKVLPADLQTTKSFAAELRSKNRSEFADEIERDQRNYLQGMIKQFPDSPWLKRRLAEL